MNVTQEQVGENHLKLIVNLDPQDYLGKVDDEIKSLSKKVTMDGFRPGKVPQGMVKKMYGDEVLAEQLNKIISDSLTNYIKEHQLKVFGDPLPLQVKKNRIDVRHPEAFSFGFEVGLLPAFELPPLESKTFTKKVLKIDDEMIEEEVDRLRSIHGQREFPELASEDDIVSADFVELNDDGSEKLEGVKNTACFRPKLLQDEPAREKLLSLKKEESMELNIRSAFGNDEELVIHHILHTDHHTAEKMNERFQLRVKSIVRVIKAPVSQDFFDKVYGEGTVKSIEEMRDKIKERLAETYKEHSDSKLDVEIQKYLMNETRMDLPLSFMRRLMETNNEKTVIDDNVFARSADLMKWDMISNRLETLHQIKPTEEDVQNEAVNHILDYFGADASYLFDKPDHLSALISSVMKDEKNVSEFHRRATNKKLFALLRSMVTTQEEEVDKHEFFHH